MRPAARIAVFVTTALAWWPIPAQIVGAADPEPDGAFATYVGSDPAVRVRFDYPRGWRLRQERGAIDAFVSVRLLGPRNARDTYTAYIVVRGSPLQAQGGLYAGAGAFVARFLETAPPDALVESRVVTPVDGHPAEDLTLSYSIPPFSHAGLAPVRTRVKTRTLVLERPAHLYELIYSADAQDYEAHAAAFARVLESLRFR
jgi:hypothetical protein